MAFEQKRMDEADKALYESWGIREPLMSAFRSWTVDEKNGIYLVSFGGRGEMPDDGYYPPDYFLLRYKESNVLFEGRTTSKTIVENERWMACWEFDMSLPAQLEAQVDEILNLIADALLCHKLALRPGLVGKIEMHIVANSIQFTA